MSEDTLQQAAAYGALQKLKGTMSATERAEVDTLEKMFWARRELLDPPRWELWGELRRLRERYARYVARTHGELYDVEHWLGCSPGATSWWRGERFGEELYVRNLSNARVRLLPEWYGYGPVHVTLAPGPPCKHEPACWCLGSGHSQLWCSCCGALGRVSLYRSEGAEPLADSLQHELRALESPAWVTWTAPSG